MSSSSVVTEVPADAALNEILQEISVPMAVLEEARRRRDRVLAIAEEHDAARDGAGFASGSVAHGTANRPLEDADCGVKVNRRFEAFRAFGPDAAEDRGPEAFIKLFSEFVLPRFRRHYPNAEVNLSGNRAIKFLINETVEIDEWGAVDPYVELIVGLDRVGAPGILDPQPARAQLGPRRACFTCSPTNRHRRANSQPTSQLGRVPRTSSTWDACSIHALASGSISPARVSISS